MKGVDVLENLTLLGSQQYALTNELSLLAGMSRIPSLDPTSVYGTVTACRDGDCASQV